MVRKSGLGAALLSFLIILTIQPRAWGASTTSAQQPSSPSGPASAARVESAKSLNDNLRQAVSDSLAKLGKLEPWQKKIFDEEVLPQAQKFVRDYSGNSAVVDTDAIRNFLKFYGPLVYRTENQKVLALVKPSADCAPCLDAKERVQELVKSRLERRGLTPVWVGAEEAEALKGSFKQQSDRLMELALKQGMNVVYATLLEPVPVDDIDSAHADEKRFYVHSFLYLRDVGRQEGKLEIMETEPFDGPVVRLMNDAINEVGVKLARMPVDPSGAGRNEVQIEVTGLADFSTFTQAKQALVERLRNEGPVEERKLARGRAIFALITSKNAEVVRKQLHDLSMSGASLSLAKPGPGANQDADTADAQLIRLEVRR